MGRSVRRGDRQFKRQKRKDEEARLRRRREEPFIGTCRWLGREGWIPALSPDRSTEDYDPGELRARIQHLCSNTGVKPGDSRSWELLFHILEDLKVPLETRGELLTRWTHAVPDDPAPYLHRIYHRVRNRDISGAARVVLEARGTPAARQLAAALKDLTWQLGVDLIREAEKLESARRLRVAMTPRADEPRHGKPARGSELPDGRSGESPGESPEQQPPAAKPILAKLAEADAGLPASAPIVFEPVEGEALLAKLRRGERDSASALELASQAAGLLAADHFDRLLSLDTLHGVDHLGYQMETVFRVLKRFRGRVLLADEVGLGKTIEACTILKEYLIRGQVHRALILVPAALVGQWTAELEEKFGIEARSSRDSGFRRDPDAFWSSPGVLVVSLATARGAAHRARVLEQKFDLVIVDEAHHLKNRRTKSWELVNGLRSRFFLMLTATPVETDLAELYNLVTLLRPGTLGTLADFRRRFVDSRDPSKPRDPEKLRKLLGDVMIRNTRALCGVLLPPRVARTLIVDPYPEEKELYDLLLEATRIHGSSHRMLFRLLLEEAGSSPRAVAKTARLASINQQDGEGIVEAMGKIEDAARTVERTAKLDRLQALLHEDRVLVFTRFRASMEQIAAKLARNDVPFFEFHGAMTGSEKDAAVRAFADAKSCVLLCSEIGGEGRNLQFCHRMVNFDLPWNPMSIEQRIGRLHRIGQKEEVDVTNLAAAGTAEEKILNVLDRRLHLFELVVGEMDLVLGDLSTDQDFGERVFDIYASSRTEQDLDRGFDRLAQQLLEGRGRLEKVKALDEALFGEDYEA